MSGNVAECDFNQFRKIYIYSKLIKFDFIRFRKVIFHNNRGNFMLLVDFIRLRTVEFSKFIKRKEKKEQIELKCQTIK